MALRNVHDESLACWSGARASLTCIEAYTYGRRSRRSGQALMTRRAPRPPKLGVPEVALRDADFRASPPVASRSLFQQDAEPSAASLGNQPGLPWHKLRAEDFLLFGQKLFSKPLKATIMMHAMSTNWGVFFNQQHFCWMHESLSHRHAGSNVIPLAEPSHVPDNYKAC